MEEADTKWFTVLSKKNEVLYYCNKITKQQKWTTKNCFCPKSKITSLPVLPCCIKEPSTKQQETIRKKDYFNSNMTASYSLEMLSEKEYCLSDIIQELEMHKKRKNYENDIFSTKKKRSNTTITNLPVIGSDVSLTTQNISMATNTVSMVTNDILVSNNAVPLSTRYVSVGTNTDTVAQEDDSVEQEDDSEEFDDDSSNSISPVSMSTQDVPAVVMLGAETQCVSISTDGDGLEIVDQITSPTAKINELNTKNNNSFVTDKVVSDDSHDDSVNLLNNDKSKEEARDSAHYYRETNIAEGLNEETNNSNNEGNSENHSETEKPRSKSSKKKKKIKDKPKRGRGRPRKEIPPQFRKYTSQPVSLSTTEDLAVTADDDSAKGEAQAEHSISASEDVPMFTEVQAESANSLGQDIDVASSSHEVHAPSGNLAESENIDAVCNTRPSPPLLLTATKDLHETTSDSLDGGVEVETSMHSGSEHITMSTRAEEGQDIPTFTHKVPVDEEEVPVKCFTANIPSPPESEVAGDTGVANYFLYCEDVNTAKLPSGSTDINTTSGKSVLNIEMSGKSSEKSIDAKQHNCPSSGSVSTNHSAASPNVLSNSSLSLLTPSDCSVQPESTVKRPRGRPRKVLLPDDLPTMVNLPTFTPQPATPLSSVNQPSKTVENTVTPDNASTIKFVSDTSLHVRSGSMFFYPQNVKQTTPARQTNMKNLESIADSLKDISGKTVRGDSSVQAVAWLINVLSELDVKKDTSKLVNKANVQVNGGSKDACNLNPSSNHAPPPVPKPNLCSSSAARSMMFSDNERIHQLADSGVQPTRPVNHIQPAVKTVFQPHHHQPVKVSEVHASYVDVSWRIVTSTNGRNSSSLKSFYKLVPVRVDDDTQVENGACSFLGVPVYSNTQVIAKLLNTSVPEEDNEVFAFEHSPNVTRRVVSKMRQPAVTLSFEWVEDTVNIMSKRYKTKNRSNADNPLREDSVGLALPKPLKLPKEGCKVYLGDFQVICNDVEFVVNHTVTVSETPRPYLSIPADALAKSSSGTQTTRCKVVGIARNDVQTSKGTPVEKPTKTDKRLSRRCHFCGAYLGTLRDIRYHRKIHPAPLGVKCSECPRRFLTASRLSVHIVKHSGQVTRICEMCSKNFSSTKMLYRKDCTKHHHKICTSCRVKTKCKKCGGKRRKKNASQQTRSHIKAHYPTSTNS